MMTDTRELGHQLIDRLPETQLSGLVQFLKTIVDPVANALRNAPLDDESETEDEKAAVTEARTWLQNNGGKGIPHAEAMRRLGLAASPPPIPAVPGSEKENNMESNLDQKRRQAHALLDLLPAEKLNAVRSLLEVLVEPLARSLALAPVEDEEITPETAAALVRSRRSLARGEGIPHEEILREFRPKQ